MMYKLIVCDLDETLLSGDKTICRENIEAVARARKKGVKFVPATGRGYTSIDAITTTLGLCEESGEYVISNNGAIITENKGLRQLAFHELSYSLAEKIIMFGLERDLCIQVFTGQDVYAFNLNPDEEKWLLSFKDDAVLCRDHAYSFLKAEQIVKVLYQSADLPYLYGLEETLTDDIKDDATIAYSSNRYMEFTARGVDKGAATKELAGILGISIEEVLAIGDNYNDLAMLQAAGMSAAVANALPDIKKACGYCSPKTNDEGAVAEIIQKFVLSE